MGTITLMETTPTTLLAPITECIVTFAVFKIFSLYDVLSHDPFCACIPIGIYLSISLYFKKIFLFIFSYLVLQCFVSVYSCIYRIPKTFCPYLLTFFCISFV